MPFLWCPVAYIKPFIFFEGPIIGASSLVAGLKPDQDSTIDRSCSRPIYLIVSTLKPQKEYHETHIEIWKPIELEYDTLWL